MPAHVDAIVDSLQQSHIHNSIMGNGYSEEIPQTTHRPSPEAGSQPIRFPRTEHDDAVEAWIIWLGFLAAAVGIVTNDSASPPGRANRGNERDIYKAI